MAIHWVLMNICVVLTASQQPKHSDGSYSEQGTATLRGSMLGPRWAEPAEQTLSSQLRIHPNLQASSWFVWV